MTKFEFLLLSIIVVTSIGILIKVFLSWNSKNKNNNDEKSNSDGFDNLSKINEVKDNIKYINQIIEEKSDSQSILKALENKKLEQLFFIKKNIEDTVNSGINFENNAYKLLGIYVAFLTGVYTTLYMGYYSNVKSNLISHMITNIHKIDSESIGQLNNISEVLKSEFNFENKVTAVLLVSALFLIVLIAMMFKGEYKYVIDNRIPVLLEQVKLAIEIEKEKYKESIKLNKNGNETVITEIIKTTENKARIETLTIKLKNKKVLVKKKLILKKKSSIKKQKVLKDNYKLINPQLYYIEKML